MNILTQCSLFSLFYLLLLVAVWLYCKYGKRDKLKKVLKEDVAFITLVMLIVFNVGGFIIWIAELIWS